MAAAWHTRGMSFLHVLRLRVGIAVDALVTLTIVLLALGLVVGYQVLGRRIRAALDAPDPGFRSTLGGDG